MSALVKPAAGLILLVAVALAGCGSLPPTESDGLPSITVGTTPGQASLPEEAILILMPGDGSRLVGQVHVEGVADTTFEQTLVIQVVLSGDPEQVLVQQPVIIQAELGQRGPFSADMSLSGVGPADQAGEVRVYSTSPRDGGLTHLASTQVTLSSSGQADVRTAETAHERITITLPVPAGVVSGGTAHVEGVALASFEQTLVARIYDGEGALIGEAPITVQAADMGIPGTFSVDIGYAAGAAGPGRIVVLDPSPAFGQTLHLASVEIQFEP